MKFSGKGPAIHQQNLGEPVVLFHDQAADFPWNCGGDEGDQHQGVECQHEPRVGQKCAAEGCEHVFQAGQMVYMTIETEEWVCWRHIEGLAGPAVEG